MIGGRDAGRTTHLGAMERSIGVLLRLGVWTSAGIVLLGIVGMAVTRNTGYAVILPHHLSALLTFHPADGPGYFPISPRRILVDVAGARPYAIIEFGILVLIVTPVLRVALSVPFFLAQRDWLYAAITSFVLAVLLASLAVGTG